MRAHVRKLLQDTHDRLLAKMQSEALPLIISAPHAQTKIPEVFRKRIDLGEYEIWQMSDPFSDETCEHPHAFAIEIGKNHRTLGDFNRDKSAKNLFPTHDFYGRKIWRAKCELTDREKQDLLDEFWTSYRKKLKKHFRALVKTGAKKILFVDHHNTAIDHPIKGGEYAPPIIIGNFGEHKTGEEIDIPTTASKKTMKVFQAKLEKNLPSLTIEINKIYRGDSILRFVRDEIRPLFPGVKIQAVILEYNLNFIWNPLTHRRDRVAQKKLTTGINTAITELCEELI